MSRFRADAFKRDQRRYYDQTAQAYDAGLWPRENRNHLLKIQKIAHLLEIQEGDLILEVGMGTGIHADWMISHIPARLVGLDLSLGMIQQAQRRLTHKDDSRSRLVCGDGEALPFPSNTFERVFCSGTLHHSSDPAAMVRELTRAAKPRGRVVVMEPNWLFPSNFIPALVTPIERNILRMRRGNLAEWAAAAPLDHIEVEHFLHTPPFPRSLFPVYERIDALAPKIPFLRLFSIMLVLSARKKQDATD